MDKEIIIIEACSLAAIKYYANIFNSETSTETAKEDAYKRLHKVCYGEEYSEGTSKNDLIGIKAELLVKSIEKFFENKNKTIE